MRIRTVPDLLALAPYRLGFRPEDSLVALSVVADGETACAGPMARVGVEDLASVATGPDDAARIVSVLTGPGTLDLVLVVYAAEPFAQARRRREITQAVLVMADAMSLHAPRLEPPEAWLVAADGWGHLGPCECCARAGEPLEAIRCAPLAAEMVLDGRVVRESRQELAIARTSDADSLLRAELGLGREAEAFDATSSAGWRERVAGRWDKALERGAGPEALGRLLLGLADSVVRDAVIAAALAGGKVTGWLEADPGDALMGSPPRPGRGSSQVIGLIEQVAAHAPPGGAAPPLGVLAYLAWWSGDGPRAEVLATQALAEDPAYRLAQIVVKVIGRATPPPWADPDRAA